LHQNRTDKMRIKAAGIRYHGGKNRGKDVESQIRGTRPQTPKMWPKRRQIQPSSSGIPWIRTRGHVLFANNKYRLFGAHHTKNSKKKNCHFGRPKEITRLCIVARLCQGSRTSVVSTHTESKPSTVIQAREMLFLENPKQNTSADGFLGHAPISAFAGSNINDLDNAKSKQQ